MFKKITKLLLTSVLILQIISPVMTIASAYEGGEEANIVVDEQSVHSESIPPVNKPSINVPTTNTPTLPQTGIRAVDASLIGIGVLGVCGGLIYLRNKNKNKD